MHIEDNKPVIRIKPKTIRFDLSKDVDNNLKYEIDFIIKHNKSLAEQVIKARLVNYWPNISMKTKFMNMENSKTNDPQSFHLNLLQRLDLSKNTQVDMLLFQTYLFIRPGKI